jgi:predicted GNAT superfamily acetyltransferase
MRLTRVEPGDLAEVLAVNAAAVPNVGDIGLDQLAHLVEESTEALLLRDQEGVAGFVLLLEPSARYESPNFRWFQARHQRFLYVDRIVVAERCRGLGLGRRLYDRVFAVARQRGIGLVTCEVNLVPPNPESLEFHARLGFHRVADVAHVPGEKEVTMMIAEVPA